ncbi:MAG: Protein GrpE [bacterium]|nr:Protein GrpE [bacterium]
MNRTMPNDEQTIATNAQKESAAAAETSSGAAVTAEEATGKVIDVEAESRGDRAKNGASTLPHEPGNGADTVEAELEAEKPKKDRFDFRRRALLKELEQKEKEFDQLRDEYAKQALQYAELKDRYLRLAAEMENSRKRLEREFANRAEGRVTEVLAELLPVVDDLERFFDAGGETKDYDSLAAGARLIYQNVLKILQSRGVKAMEAVGQPFDPNRHEALLQMPAEGQASNLVIQETTKGYLQSDKVLRPAKVIVSA